MTHSTTRMYSAAIAMLMLGCGDDPCPPGWWADRGADRCALVVDAALVPHRDAGNPSPIGEKEPPAADASLDARPTFDASVIDAQLPVAPEPPDASVPVIQATAWPAGRVRFCFGRDTTARSDFTVLAAQFKQAAESSWPGASSLSFESFQPCSGSTLDTVVVTLRDGDDFEVSDGFLGHDAEHQLILGVGRSLVGSLVPHAIGHVLGLTTPHEHGACSNAALADALNTLDAGGECRSRPLLSRSDRKRAQRDYGPRGATPDAPAISFDGDRAADVVLVTPSATTPGATALRTLLSSNRGLGAAGSGTWAELAAQPLDLRVGDFDGDGLVDLALLDAATLSVRFSTGRAFEAPLAPWTLALSAGDKLLVGDFDRDSRTDVVEVRANGELWLALAGSDGFAPWQRWQSADVTQTGGIESRYLVGDFNHDGYDDLAYKLSKDVGNVLSNSTLVQLSDASAVLRAPAVWSQQVDFGAVNEGIHYVGNFVSDGIDDLGYFEPADAHFWAIPSDKTHFVGSGDRTSVNTSTQEFYTLGTLTDARLIGDFNASGRDDVLLVDHTLNKLRLFANREDSDGYAFLPEANPADWAPLALELTNVKLTASSHESLGR